MIFKIENYLLEEMLEWSERKQYKKILLTDMIKEKEELNSYLVVSNERQHRLKTMTIDHDGKINLINAIIEVLFKKGNERLVELRFDSKLLMKDGYIAIKITRKNLKDMK